MSPHAEAVAVIAAAGRVVRQAKRGQSSAGARTRDEEAALANEQAELARLTAAEDAAAALRHLDGDAAAPAEPERTKRLKALASRIPKRRAAIPVLKAREKETAKEVEAANAAFARAVVSAVQSIQEPAAERIRSTLAELEEPLRDLLIADRLRVSLIGDRFSLDADQVAPFGGAVIARKLINGIVARIMPAQLDPARLDTAALNAATALILETKGNDQ